MGKKQLFEYAQVKQAVMNEATFRSGSGQSYEQLVGEIWSEFADGRLKACVSQNGVSLLEPTKGAQRFELRRKHKPIVAMRKLALGALEELVNAAADENIDGKEVYQENENFRELVDLIQTTDLGR